MTDNTSEKVHWTTDWNTESSSQVFRSFPQLPTLPISSIVIGLVTGVTGACANAVVLAVLVFARRHYGSHVGLTENAGHENDGPSKLQDMKLQDMKLSDQFSRYLQGMKLQDMKMTDRCRA